MEEHMTSLLNIVGTLTSLGEDLKGRFIAGILSNSVPDFCETITQPHKKSLVHSTRNMYSYVF